MGKSRAHKYLEEAFGKIFEACAELGMVENPEMNGMDNVIAFIRDQCVHTQIYPVREDQRPVCPGSDQCGHYARYHNCDGCSRTIQHDLFEPL
jgi:hypothetical protein